MDYSQTCSSLPSNIPNVQMRMDGNDRIYTIPQGTTLVTRNGHFILQMADGEVDLGDRDEIIAAGG